MIHQIRFTIVYLVKSSNFNLSFLFNPCPGLFSPMSESRGASSKLSSTYFFRFLLYIYRNFSKGYRTGGYGIYPFIAPFPDGVSTEVIHSVRSSSLFHACLSPCCIGNQVHTEYSLNDHKAGWVTMRTNGASARMGIPEPK